MWKLSPSLVHFMVSSNILQFFKTSHWILRKFYTKYKNEKDFGKSVLKINIQLSLQFSLLTWRLIVFPFPTSTSAIHILQQSLRIPTDRGFQIRRPHLNSENNPIFFKPWACFPYSSIHIRSQVRMNNFYIKKKVLKILWLR